MTRSATISDVCAALLPESSANRPDAPGSAAVRRSESRTMIVLLNPALTARNASSTCARVTVAVVGALEPPRPVWGPLIRTSVIVPPPAVA